MPWVQRYEGNLRWTLLPEWESVLLGEGDWPLDRWRRHYHVRCIKDASHRAVYRIEAPDRIFYVKQYRSPRWTDRLGNLLRGCPAVREFHTLFGVAQRGIPTLQPIAWACGRRGRGLWDSFLLTQAILNTQSLDEYVQHALPQLPPKTRSRLERSLLEELAGFLAQCHRAGILHRDLHAGNLLVVPQSSFQTNAWTPPAFRFFLIDVVAVRLQGPLGREASLRNLALLAGAWREKTTPAQRWRFWKSYTEARPELVFDLVKDAEQVDRLGIEHRLQVCRRRDRRALANNRDFFVLRNQWGEAHAVADQSAPLIEAWMRIPEEFLEGFLHQAVKLGHRAVVVKADWPPRPETFSPWNAFPESGGKGDPLRGPYSGPHFARYPSFPVPGDFEEQDIPNPVSSFGGDASGEGPRGKTDFLDLGDSFQTRGSPLRGGAYSIEERNFAGPERPLWEDGRGPCQATGSTTSPSKVCFTELETLRKSSPPTFLVAMKRFRETVGWRGFLRPFRNNRGRRAWRIGHALLQRGIPTPRPIALCEPRFQGLPYYTYLATEWIVGSEDIHHWGWRIAQLPPAQRRQEAMRCAESLGRLIGRLHAFRITHTDLKMPNILVSGQGEHLRTWLVDLGGVQIGTWHRRRYLKDLARLAIGLHVHPWVSPTIVCRFCKVYAEQFPLRNRPDWKTVWRKVQEESVRLVRQRKREGRAIM